MKLTNSTFPLNIKILLGKEGSLIVILLFQYLFIIIKKKDDGIDRKESPHYQIDQDNFWERKDNWEVQKKPKEHLKIDEGIFRQPSYTGLTDTARY